MSKRRKSAKPPRKIAAEMVARVERGVFGGTREKISVFSVGGILGGKPDKQQPKHVQQVVRLLNGGRA